MKVVYGDFWKYFSDRDFIPPDVVKCLTTNGFVKKNGTAVMGKGIAQQAVKRYPTIAKALGDRLRLGGNHVYDLGYDSEQGWLYSFPVKTVWWENADLALIEQSADELVTAVKRLGQIGLIVLPRPGCGNGGLVWEDVKEVIEPYFDDRFHIIDYKRRT